MSLPTKATVKDAEEVCKFLAKKPTGATLKEAKAVVDEKHLEARKLAGLKSWGFVEDEGGRLKVTAPGRELASHDPDKRRALYRTVINSCAPYRAVLERAVHQNEESVSSVDVAAYWHGHFRSEVASSEEMLNLQVLTFFSLAEGAGLGRVTIGRRGSPTRIGWDPTAFTEFPGGSCVHGAELQNPERTDATHPDSNTDTEEKNARSPVDPPNSQLGQAIFVAHGKSKGPLEDLKKILSQFRIPFKVVVEEPNLGRPISEKVRETMKECNCAIFLFTADEKLFDEKGGEVWKPSENVVFEFGACAYLYGKRVVLVKEEKVVFPTNFRDIGYISFMDGELNAKAMDILKELISFGILKVSI